MGPSVVLGDLCVGSFVIPRSTWKICETPASFANQMSASCCDLDVAPGGVSRWMPDLDATSPGNPTLLAL